MKKDELIRVGIGRRNYGYMRVCYGLQPPKTRFVKVPYLPWDRLRRNDQRLQNSYFFNPLSGVDLFHLWNGVSFNNRPWVTHFEAHLPRFFMPAGSWSYQKALERLHHGSCKRLLALSEFARDFFVWQNPADGPALLQKTEVFYGAVPLQPQRERPPATPLRLCMVGHAFFQKGGVGVLRAFERLRAEGLAIELHLVSNLLPGDFVTRTTVAERDRVANTLRQTPGIHWHEHLPHADVIALLSDCHIGLLPSLDDTFGWSATEAMSAGLPVIATNLCALPEIVKHGRNGFVIDLPRQKNRRWAGLAERDEKKRRQELDNAYDVIAEGTYRAIVEAVGDPAGLERMSNAARDHIREHHDPERLSARLRQVYEAALQ